VLAILGFEVHVLVGAGGLFRQLQRIVAIREHQLLRERLLILLAAQREFCYVAVQHVQVLRLRRTLLVQVDYELWHALSLTAVLLLLATLFVRAELAPGHLLLEVTVAAVAIAFQH